MDEASSKYLDTIVMSKLLEEKLELVSHSSSLADIKTDKSLFADFADLEMSGNVTFKECGTNLELISPIDSPYPENQKCSVVVYPAEKQIASIILTHGLYEDNRDIYSFLIKGLNRAGYTVYQTTLPYHFDRTPESSQFSGEYFWSADISRTKVAFKQAVYELYQLFHHLEQVTGHPVFLSGFSMGASVSLTLAALTDSVPAFFAINPPAGLTDIVWDSPLCRTIKRDLLSSGLTESDLKSAFSDLEPIEIESPIADIETICLAYAEYDQVTEQYQYNNIIEKWKLTHTHKYKAGHLNTLRVPRLANDMDTFFKVRMNRYADK